MKPISPTQDQLTVLRHAIARAMGDGWTHKPDPTHTWHNTMITGPQGATITIGSSSDDKIVIGGWSENYSNTSSYNRYEMPTIRVTYERGPAIIHKEIVRRFLPGFWRALQSADKATAERDAHCSDSTKTYDAICATLTLSQGRPRNIRNDEGGGMIYMHMSTGSGRSEIRVNSADSVDFTVTSMSRERAIKLAGFLSTL